MSTNRKADPDIAPEYDFSNGRRGVYLERARQGIALVPSEKVPTTESPRPAVKPDPPIGPRRR